MKTYIVAIGKYKHDDFHMSCWSVYPCNLIYYRLKAENIDKAKQKAKNFCIIKTESENKYKELTLKNYNKETDECKYKIENITCIDDYPEII